MRLELAGLHKFKLTSLTNCLYFHPSPKGYLSWLGMDAIRVPPKAGVGDRTQTYAVGVDGVIQNQDESFPQRKERFKCLDAVSSVNVFGTKYVKNW